MLKNTLELFQTICSTVSAHTNGRVETFILVNGKKVKCTGRANSTGSKDTHTMVSIKMISNMVKGRSSGILTRDIVGIGPLEKNMDMARR